MLFYPFKGDMAWVLCTGQYKTNSPGRTIMSKPLAGKTALVTGGSRGIGAAIVKRLAKDGADVAITFVSSPQKADEVVKAIEALGQRGVAIQADSADAEAVRSAVDEAAKTFGKLDILVNNAGIGIIKPVDEFSLEDFAPRR
jgi:3-oxoacyl-[acyl-carrier protein] reductase